jgi:hypothetical protein
VYLPAWRATAKISQNRNSNENKIARQMTNRGVCLTAGRRNNNTLPFWEVNEDQCECSVKMCQRDVSTNCCKHSAFPVLATRQILAWWCIAWGPKCWRHIQCANTTVITGRHRDWHFWTNGNSQDRELISFQSPCPTSLSQSSDQNR